MWANTYDDGDITTPFGGYKQSGIGRDKSLHTFDKFTQVKTTWIQLGCRPQASTHSEAAG